MKQTTVEPTCSVFGRKGGGGHHRSEGQGSNPKFDLGKASRLCLGIETNNVKAILETEDGDQVVLALMKLWIIHTAVRAKNLGIYSLINRLLGVVR